MTVSGASVLASSLDNQLYSLNLDSGNQRWRYDLQGYTQQAVSIQDGLLYLAYTGRRIAAMQDQGNAAGMIWQKDLPFEPTTPFTIWQDMLFIGVGDGGDARLLAIRRQNPDDRREFNDPNARLQLPAIGQETIYVGADRLWALDINMWNSLETVWISPDVNNVVAPPVYAYPGVVKLAELFVADSSNIVSALDANTGLRFWTHNFGGPISALAVNENSVFVVGNGVLRALSRQNGQPLWTQSVGGAAMGGPLVTTDRVLVVTQGGGIFFFDAVSGAIVDAATSAPSSVAGGPAVSGGTWLFIPASNNNVYAYRGSP